MQLETVIELHLCLQSVNFHPKSKSLFFNILARKISIKNNDVETEPSTLDQYAKRSTFQGDNNDSLQCNLLNFVSTYSVVNDEIRKRAFPNLYSNPKSAHCPLSIILQITDN